MENWERRFDRVQPPDSSVPSHREALRQKLQSHKIPAGHGRRNAAALGVMAVIVFGVLSVSYPSWAKALWNTVYVKTITLRTKDGGNVVIKKMPLSQCAADCDTIGQLQMCEADGRRVIAIKKQLKPGEVKGDSFSISTEAIINQLNLEGSGIKSITVSTPDGEDTWIVNGDTIDSKDISRTVEQLPEASTGPKDFEWLSASDKVSPEITAEFELAQNYPNPFNPTTQLSFSLRQAGNASLKVFNLMGQEIATLVNGHTDAGRHMVTFDGTNLPSGSYLYTLQTEQGQLTKTMVLAK